MLSSSVNGEVHKMSESYTSVAWFKVKEGRNDDFERGFHDAGMLTRSASLDGCLDTRLYQSTDGTNQYFVIGHWDSKESYALWQEMAVPGAPKEALRRMTDALEENRLGVLMFPANNVD